MPRVVKLGGSLLASPWLRTWLTALARTKHPVVIVPGGGIFADAVRSTQASLGFPEATAHHMALLAMTQYGLALCGMEARLRPASTNWDIGETLSKGLIPVWLPVTMCLGTSDLPEDWTVTSDSLAAWLAAVLNAEALGVVKHGVTQSRPYYRSKDEYLVDDAFARFAEKFGRPIDILAADQADGLDAWLASTPSAVVAPYADKSVHEH